MKLSGKILSGIIYTLVVAVLISACAPATSSPTQEPTHTNSPTEIQLPTATASPVPTSTPTPEPIYLRVDPDLPLAFQNSIQLEGTDFEIVNSGKTSAVLDYGRGNPVSSWVYALAAPFPTILDDIPAQIGLARGI